MAGRADRHRVESCAGEVADRGGIGDRQDERQRPGPEARGQRLGAGIEARDTARRRHVGHVRDERIEPRPALGLVERRHGPRIRRIGRQAVNRLGRYDDQPAGPKRGDRAD